METAPGHLSILIATTIIQLTVAVIITILLINPIPYQASHELNSFSMILVIKNMYFYQSEHHRKTP